MSVISGIGGLWNSIQTWLIPNIEDDIGKLDERQKEFVAVCEMCEPEKFMAKYEWIGNGCPPSSRLSLFKAFVAKASWNFESTSHLLDAIRHNPSLRRLCGWETLVEVPSNATFSRAFTQFADDRLPQLIHEAMIKRSFKDKIVGHSSIDSTAIEIREKAVDKKVNPKATAEEETKKNEACAVTEVKGSAAEKKSKTHKHRRKSEPPQPPEPTRLELQMGRSVEENLTDLPRGCDWGCKKNSQGKTEQWKGGKLHIAAGDGDVPLAFLLSSASMHDSQGAIPLMQMTYTRVTSLYDLGDSAYDAAQIKEMSAKLGHIPIIDHNKRRGPEIKFAPAEKMRYRERTSVERINSHLHDNHGGRTIRVKGHSKVEAHLAFGLLVIAAEQLFGMLC